MRASEKDLPVPLESVVLVLVPLVMPLVPFSSRSFEVDKPTDVCEILLIRKKLPKWSAQSDSEGVSTSNSWPLKIVWL